MCSTDEYGETVRRILDLRRNVPLLQAAMEILAVTAYQRPVTKAFVEQVRGVGSPGVISSLCERGLVEEWGKLDLPGQLLLYGIMLSSLHYMSFPSLSDPPPLPQSSPEGSEKEENETTEETL